MNKAEKIPIVKLEPKHIKAIILPLFYSHYGDLIWLKKALFL